jgi:transposase
MAAYSQDLRDRVLNAVQRGDRPTDIAARFEVSRMWVYAVKDRFDKDGQRTALPVGGYRRSRIAHLELTLRTWIKEQADLTLSEMCERLAGQGVQIKVPALWHQLNKWGLSFKKNAARQRARARGRSVGQASVATAAVGHGC